MKELLNLKVFLSLIFFLVIFYILKDTPIFQDKSTLIFLFVVAPILIYLFVKYLFYKKG